MDAVLAGHGFDQVTTRLAGGIVVPIPGILHVPKKGKNPQ